ncbi:MAG: hypothetical protein JRI46_10940, partial [Deltaproteobacteria bacterium]|nr:hypothetical protein [Deltaproteobacteria bacterium]
ANTGVINRIFRPDGSVTGFGGSTTSIIYLKNARNDRFRVVITSSTGGVRTSKGW